MALIQVFGRWGSSTVLHYLRDAVLGLKGSNVQGQFRAGFLKAHPEVQVSAGDLSARIADEVRRLAPADSSEPLLAPVIASVTESVTEEVMRRCHAENVRVLDGSSALSSLAGRVEQLDLDLRVVSGEVPAAFKQCHGGLIHRALPRGTSPCGWPWRLKQGREVSQSEFERACESSDLVCLRCK